MTEVTDSHLTTISFQVVLENSEVLPSPSSLPFSFPSYLSSTEIASFFV